MRPIQIKTSKGVLLADRAWQATLWSERARGWLGKPSVKDGEGLLLTPASSVHSLGMAFEFDLAFLDRDGRVLKTVAPMRRQRLAWGPWWGKGVQALELPAGSLAKAGVTRGDVLSVEER